MDFHFHRKERLCRISAAFRAEIDGVNSAKTRPKVRPWSGNLQFLFDGISPVCRYTGGTAASNIDRRYYGDGEQRLESGNWTGYFYARDHLGSVREVVKSDSTLAARYDFDPYGKRITAYQSTSYIGGCDFGFTGHVTLESAISGQTELVLTHFRLYDPEQGKWLSADPLGEEGGMNLYGYVGGNPMMNFDPLGLDLFSWSDADPDDRSPISAGQIAEAAANFTMGFGDSFTLNLSKAIRDKAFGEHYTNKCSKAYKGGEWTGIAASLVAGGGGAAKAAGGLKNVVKYELGQKWLPRMATRAGRLDKWVARDPVTRGEIILKSAKGNWIKAFAPDKIFAPMAPKALRTGPTPLAGGVVHAGAQGARKALSSDNCEESP